MVESCPLPSGREETADTVDWRTFTQELRRQWRTMWRERIDDKFRAEGIASRDFRLLFVDRGTIVIATRKFKELDFKEILDLYEAPYEVKVRQCAPSPYTGGWRKFGKKIAAMRRETKRTQKSSHDSKQQTKRDFQLKKNGRGWLHYRR